MLLRETEARDPEQKILGAVLRHLIYQLYFENHLFITQPNQYSPPRSDCLDLAV